MALSELGMSLASASPMVASPGAAELAAVGFASAAGGERRILAVVLPELLHELARERLRAPRSRELSIAGSRSSLERVEAPAVPRAVVLSDAPRSMLEPTTLLDAVNIAARRRGVTPRHTIAQATAIVENLQICALPPAGVSQALQQVAEAALAFGTPVSFRAPDTVWVDVSGTCQLFGGELELALALVAHVRALGHAARVAVASGPWQAQSFARYADFDETGILCVAAADAAARSGLLPIRALPLADDVVAWCARLGLLTLDDLRKLPAAALAARIEARGCERTLDLIRGRDDGVLDAHRPEELPFEEQSWDYPLENVEPLLFVLKGLAARLGSRLEGRGQAARELLLSVRYDKGSVALREREGAARQEGAARRGECSALAGRRQPLAGKTDARFPESLQLPFRLASPLAHPEDLERIVRARLQRETLFAPACGLRLQVTAITEARQWQQSLNIDGGLRATLSADPRTLAVLVAELSADVGSSAVGRLETQDSHLLEKSSQFVPIHRSLIARGRPNPRDFPERGRPNPRGLSPAASAKRAGSATASVFDTSPSQGETIMRLPTRLLSPIEFNAPLKENELVVLERRAFVIESIQFEERLEAVEWWAPSPVSRDYFRLWLSASPQASRAAFRTASQPVARGDGIEVLVYLNRDDDKKYVQALYD
jgi:protein ImuB